MERNPTSLQPSVPNTEEMDQDDKMEALSCLHLLPAVEIFFLFFLKYYFSTL